MTVIHRGDERIVVPALPLTPLGLKKGDLVEHTMPGGGGWGQPAERPPEAVALDLLQERISPAAAARAYGRSPA